MKRRPDLKSSLVLSFVLVGILPILVIGFFALQTLTRGMEEQISSRNFVLAQSMAREVDRFIGEPLAILGHVAEVVERQAFFREVEIDKYLETVKTYYGFFNSIQVLDPRGIVKHQAPYVPSSLGLDLSEHPFFKHTVLSRQPFFSRVFVSIETGEPTIVLARPFEGGILAGHLNLSSLNSLAEKNVLGPSGYAAVVDQEGMYIAHPNRKKVYERQSARKLPPVAHGLAGHEGTLQYRDGQSGMLGSVVRVSSTNWLVVVAQPEREAFTPVRRIQRIFAIGAALALCFALAAALFSLKRTLGPLSRLVADVERIARGDYAIRSQPPTYKEIDELAEGFRLMAEAVDVREQALRESEEKYRLLVDHMNDLIVEFDAERHLRFVSPSCCEVFAWNEKDFLGMDFLDLVHSEDRHRVATALEEVAQPPHTTYHEERVPTPYGVRWFAWSARAILSSSGTVESVISVGRDITEQKSAEERLRRSEKKFRDLFNSIHDLVFTQDLEGRFLNVNPALLQVFGYEQEEVLGRLASDFMKPDVRPLFKTEYLDVLKTRGVHQSTSSYFTKDGKKVYIEYHSALVRPEDGDPYITGTGRDVTDHVMAERRIQQLQNEMLQAKKMEAVGTLAGGIAHDFNNLLMGIQGTVSLLLLDTPPDHPHHERMRGIEKYVRSGADLTRQLLGFARGGRYEVKPVDINVLMEQSVGLFARTHKEITVETRFSEDLRAVEADRSQLEQVLLNLYVNAWQSMPSGGVLGLETENVQLGAEDTDPHDVTPGLYVRLRVRDTGIGMDEVTRERIFEPFFTSRKMGRGTGLGLASVYGIIKNHGGIIRVDSEPGGGTTFTIDLPASTVAVKQEKESRGDLARGTGTILLVDDEAMVLEVGTEMLTRLGYDVLRASNGQDALARFQEDRDRIGLVILDLIMPGMGGGEVFDSLRRIRSDIKVLLSSGYSVDGQAQAILDRGCDGFIQKPFDLQTLSEKVRDLLA